MDLDIRPPQPTPPAGGPPPAPPAAPSTPAVKPPAGRWRRWLIVGLGALAAVALAAGLILVLIHTHGHVKSASKSGELAIPKPPPPPTTVADPLTGLPVSPALAQRPVTAVVIENHPDARPQSGLSQAGVVYEALAEGGITRFLAFFQDQQPAVIGPVRSLRTYFVDWALEYDAPVAHAGGNADALDLVGPLGLKDMNGLNIGAPTFYRTTDRLAPHNFYTSASLLDTLEQRLGFFHPAKFTSYPRLATNTPAPAADHPNVQINFSYASYSVTYQYTATTKDYLRLLAGAPHVDRGTGQPIHVKNVVLEVMPTSYGKTRIGEDTVMMQTAGQGKAVVFRDGTAVVGTWSKASHSAHTQLLDAAGAPISLEPGNTWFAIVPPTASYTY